MATSLPPAVRRSLLALPLTATALLAACSSSNSSGGAASSTAAPAAAAPAASASITVQTHTGPLGTYLTDRTGRALYLWQADRANTSTCTGACTAAWPPLAVSATGSVKAAGAAAQQDVATITRADGSKQVTYKAHPLYYFAQDAVSGTTNGQGSDAFGAKWWVVTPAGNADTKTVAATSAPGGGGGGYGGY
ncbi:MAG: hypothetical protein QOC66_2870 [Pseudonocardiales bacterium]|nr:hypothetical protein [Pseudonocardiales bacterium]